VVVLDILMHIVVIVMVLEKKYPFVWNVIFIIIWYLVKTVLVQDI